MPTYRERISRVSAMPADLMGADFCDELAAQLLQVTQRVSKIEEQLTLLDRKITDCCDDSARLALRNEISALRREVDALKAPPPNPPSPPTG